MKPYEYCKVITADGSEIGPTLTDRNGNQFAIRGVKCSASGSATWTDGAGNSVSDYFVAGVEYSIKPVSVASGATATLLALYG